MINIFGTLISLISDSVSNDVICGVYLRHLDMLNRLFTMAIYGTYE